MTFKTPDLCDQFEADLGASVRVVAPMFKRYGGRAAFSGRIVTLKLFEDNSLVREVLAEDGRDKVLVIDGGGSMRCALVGDQLAILAHRNAWEGIVVYGCIRDSAYAKKLGLGLWIRGATPNFHAQTDIFPFGVNVPVACGGTFVMPGDIIVADDDGAVCVPIASSSWISSAMRRRMPGSMP